MILEVRNIKTKAIKIKKKEKKALSKALAYHVPNYRFMPHYKSGAWDGKKRFFHKGNKTFLTGLLPFVLKLADKKGFKIKLIDKREIPEIKRKNYKVGKKLLRPYQKKEFSKVLRTSLGIFPDTTLYWPRGIIKHPTRSGKTYFASGIIRAIDQPTLFIVGRLDLLDQTRDDFATALRMKKKEIGIIGDQKVRLKKFTVATVQTLWSRRGNSAMQDFLDSIQVLIIDECHHVSNGQYHKIVERCPAPYRFGLSGTPLSRGDLGDIMLVGDTGEIISELKRKKLEKDGWLSTATVYLIDMATPKLKPRLPYQAAYHRGIVKNDNRNEVILEEAEEAWRKRKEHVLILVRYLPHGRELLRRLRNKSINAVFLKGSSSLKKRRKFVKKVQNSKKPLIIIATSIFDEGRTLPDIRTLILAGGGASRIKLVQRIGRGVNLKSSGENTVRVIDFIDRTHKFLEEHSLERIAACKQEGFKIVKQE